MVWRAFIREGDTLTPDGGKVQPVPQQWPVIYDGKHACFEGDPVYCNACKSWGVTQCVPPYRPHAGPDGRQVNLDGDLCLCECPKAPRLKALFDNNGMHFDGAVEENENVDMTQASPWLAPANSSPAMTRFDQYFVVYDKVTSTPVDGFCYGIATPSDEYHGSLDEDGATARAYAQQAQSLTLTYVVQTTIGVRQ